MGTMSSWGKSWGKSWGNSWGAIDAAVEPTEGQKNGGAPYVPYPIPIRRKKLLTETPLGVCMLAVGAGVVR